MICTGEATRPGKHALPFAAWWRDVLERDDADEDAILRCVFCRRYLEDEIRAAAADDRTAAMLAWWQPAGESGSSVIAAGVYCHGILDQWCVREAQSRGVLLDVHAETCCGGKAMPGLERIVATYPTWEGAALRRLTLILAVLARIPAGAPTTKSNANREPDRR